MNDLEYLSKNLAEFKQRYTKFAASVSALTDAFSNAFNVPVITSHPDYLVLGLSRLCSDRFEDILILCSQRRGEGAMPLVRAMFEGLVNASYIRAHPEKAEDFIRYLFVFVKRVQTQAERLNGKILSAEQKKIVDDALASYSASGQRPRRKHDWTDLNLVDRAKDVGFAEYVVAAYYRPTETAHPSMLHLYSLSKKANGKQLMFGASEEFANQKVEEALRISHFLAIEVLVLLHKTFGNEQLKPLIARCLRDYSESWAGFDLADGQT